MTVAFAFRACGIDSRLSLAETPFEDLAEEGDALRATSSDPRIFLTPLQPIDPGWCQIVLRAEGNIRNPRVYLDFGGGMSENRSIRLDRTCGADTHWTVAWLPSTVVCLRLDPTDVPGRLHLHSLALDSLPVHHLPEALPARGPAPRGRNRRARARVLSALRRLLPLSLGNADGPSPKAAIYAAYSHLSGVSLRIDDETETGKVEVELFEYCWHGFRQRRSVTLDRSESTEGEPLHAYWEPLETSRGNHFVLRCRPSDGARAMVVDAKPIYSHPEPWSEVPHALLFSPVTACNLNCIHCISRPTRGRLERLADPIWEDVKDVARHPEFLRIATDYSGDILYNEARHGGWLEKLMSLDRPFRIDTNANYLDARVIDLLLESKLYEINFSLDSMDPGVYRRVRKGSIPLPKVLAKIAAFMESKRARGHPATTIMSFLLMRSTARTIKPAISFAREHGIDNVSVIPMIAFTPDMVEEGFVWDSQAYEALYTELTEEAKRLGVNFNMQRPVRRWFERDVHAPCDIPWGSATLLGNGDVQACCVPGTRIGSLKEHNLREIWNGQAYREFRMRVNSPNPPEPCRNCSQSRVTNNRKAYAPALYAPENCTTGSRAAAKASSVVVLSRQPSAQLHVGHGQREEADSE